MKHLIFLFSVLLPVVTFASEGPYILDFNLSDMKEVECWDYRSKDRTYRPENCEVTKEPCEFDLQTSLKKGGLTIKGNPALVNFMSGTMFRIKGQRVSSEGHIGMPVEPNVWKIISLVDAGRTIELFKVENNSLLLVREVIPLNFVLDLPKAPLPLKKTFQIKVDNGNKPPNEFDFLIYDNLLHPKDGTVEVKLPVGTYELVIKSKITWKSFTIKLIVPSGTKPGDVEKLVIRPEEIRDEEKPEVPQELPTKPTLTWVSIEGNQTGLLFHPNDPLNKYAFISVDSLKVKETGNDVLDLFNFKGGILDLPTGNEAKLIERAKGQALVTFSAKGTCGYHVPKPAGIIDVYSKANQPLSKIGSLFVNNRRKMDYVGMTSDKQKVEFTPNLFADYCQTNYLALHQPKEISSEWTNLGNGPWGKDGWVKIKSVGLFSPNNKLTYMLLGHQGVKLRYGSKGQLIGRGWVQANSESNGEGTQKEVDFPLKREDVVDRDGKIIAPLDCGYNC